MGSSTNLHQELLDKVTNAVASYFGRGMEQAAESRNRDVSDLKRDYECALRLSQAFPTAEAFDDFTATTNENVAEWLLGFPFELARAGMAVEAAHLQRVWAEIVERANFLGDRAVVLAEAGMQAEAVAQIAELNREFPDDAWVKLKTGDALRALKEPVQAEERYRNVLTTAAEQYDREGARERLVDLLRKQGKNDEALELEKQAPLVDELCEALRDGDYLTTSEIDAILANRSFFQPYLMNALAQRASVALVPEDPLDNTDFHAILLLTEMEDAGVIPHLIACLRMKEKDLHTLYADALTEDLWIPFARVGHEHLEEIWKFVTDESAYIFARGTAVAGIVAMHHFHPERRAETVAFIERLLDQTDAFPEDHLAGILCDCADSGLTELADRAQEFASHMHESNPVFSLMATAKDVRKAFRNGARKDFISRRALDVYGVNDQWRKVIQSQRRDKLIDKEQARKKIGRNDPCPCGSGKKYKKCHGK